MKSTHLYRRRYVPDEMIELKDDELLEQNENYILTRWNVLKPRKDIDHGISMYFLKKGFKVSKIFDAQNQLVYWYCDIIETHYDEQKNTYTFCDLLIDVLIYPDHHVQIVDLDEFADVTRKESLPKEVLANALQQTDDLLKIIYSGGLPELIKPIEALENK